MPQRGNVMMPRMQPNPGPRYSHGEEIANSVTHGIGAALAVSGLTVLAVTAGILGTGWHVVGSVVFGTTLLLLYVASTLYHSVQHPRAKAVLRIVDHSAIFLLIAGTYTPFTLVNLRGVWGWSLFGIVWGIAIVGIVIASVGRGRWPALSLTLYVAMGWAVIGAVKPLMASVAPGGLALLAAGGVAYTVGIIFYAWRKLPYGHAVWHVFVLAGSVCHFFAVLLFVIAGPSRP